MKHRVKILHKDWLTHDVVRFRFERPEGFSFVAGQAIEASPEGPDFKDKWSPFTLTSLSSEDDLELTFKVYKEHDGITLAFSNLSVGDHFWITEPFDTFKNKGEGVFIAGGTGVTPFIALLRQMHITGETGNSYLYFSNKTEKDIFHREEFSKILGNNFVTVLTREKKNPHLYGRIDKEFLEKNISDFNQPFYICGPDDFSEDIQRYLKELGASDEVVNVSM